MTRKQDSATPPRAAQNREQYTKSLNAVASTPHGKVLLKALKDYCIGEVPVDITNQVALIRDGALRNFYIEMISRFLEPDQKQGVDNDRWNAAG